MQLLGLHDDTAPAFRLPLLPLLKRYLGAPHRAGASSKDLDSPRTDDDRFEALAAAMSNALERGKQRT